MSSGFLGEHVVVGVYDPVYNPYNVYEGLLAAGASSVGRTVEFPDLSDLPQTGTGSVSHASIDISSHAIKLSFPTLTEGQQLPNDPYNGYVLAFKGNPTQDISSIRLLSTNIGNLTPESVRFNAHQVFINGAGADLPAGQAPYVVLGFRFNGSDGLKAHAEAHSLIHG